MDQQLVEQIFNHLDRGHTVLFGSDHFGAVRIKVKHGIFIALTSHYRTDQETLSIIQERMAGQEAGHDGGPEAAHVEPPGLGPLPDANPLPHMPQQPEAAPPPARKPACDQRLTSEELCPDFRGLLAAKDAIAADRWRAYSRAYRQRRIEDRLARQIEADEVESHRFALGTVHEGWEDLLSGNIPALAEELWRAMRPGKSVHALAEEVQAPLRACLFWLSVFKRFLDVWVDDAAGRYVFRRPEGAGDLRTAVRRLRRET